MASNAPNRDPASSEPTRPGGRTTRASGMITGVVTDTAGTALHYANVILVGKSLGAMSLGDGRYAISGVAPGCYVVKALMMGYRAATIDSVQVAAGDTAVANFSLQPTIVARTQEIVVCADRPMVDVTSSSTMGSTNNSGRRFRAQPAPMPVENVLDAVGLRAATSKSSARMHVRGGRDSEVQIQIDGVRIDEPLGRRGAAGKRGRRGARATRPPAKRTAPRPVARKTPSGPRRRYVGPMNTETYARIHENEFRNALDRPFSTFSIDVDAASYTNARRYIRAHRIPPPDAVRVEEFINYFPYNYPGPGDEHPFAIHAAVSKCPWNAAHRLVGVALQGRRVEYASLPPSNLVFLIDVSGSMQPPDKLPLLIRSFELLVDRLRDTDRVAIVVYAGSSGLVLPSTPGSKREVIRAALKALRAGGSTAGAAGIRLAYQVASKNFVEKGNNRVILATDGDFNVGVTNNGELSRLIEKERNRGVFLSVLGFGRGNLKDARMEMLADQGNGNYAYIDNILEGRRVFVGQLAGTLFTIAKDVKIQVEFNPGRVESYRLIGYENRVLRREDFANDRKDAGELGAGHSVTALYEVVPVGDHRRVAARTSSYTTVAVRDSAAASGDLLTVRLRYKQPDGKKSVLIERSLEDRAVSFEEMDEPFRFAAAVAEFAMLLRGSRYAGSGSIDWVRHTAAGARSYDPEGYRSAFLGMVGEAGAILSRGASR